ncbi:MAG TPA: hypothetical protein V6D46_01785, partial [Coleofasciculaceae cyanobacterium]
LSLVVVPLVRQLIDANAPRSTVPPSPPPASPVSPGLNPALWAVGAIGRIQPQSAALGLYDQPDQRTPIAWLPPNSVVQILVLKPALPIAPSGLSPAATKPPALPAAAESPPALPSSPSPATTTWVQLKICALGSSPSAMSPSAILKSGSVFWVRQADLGDRIAPINPAIEPTACGSTVLSPDRSNTPP